jgi:hypothetical protein
MPRPHPPVRRDDQELLQLTRRFERAKRLEARAVGRARECQAALITELGLRKLKTLRLAPDTQVTVVQSVSTVVDADGLFADLNPSQRKRVFTAEVDLNALPEPERDRVIGSLAAGVRKAITRHVLDNPALDAAIAAGKVAAELVKRRTTQRTGTPYIKISHGAGNPP